MGGRDRWEDAVWRIWAGLAAAAFRCLGVHHAQRVAFRVLHHGPMLIEGMVVWPQRGAERYEPRHHGLGRFVGVHIDMYAVFAPPLFWDMLEQHVRLACGRVGQ